MASARSAISRLGLGRSLWENQIVASTRRSAIRCFSDDTGRILSEEERAKETMYIQKMEKEIQERKKKLEQQKAESEKGSAGKKPEGSKP
ncbi:unnamed protein product [Arabis nemorensis]|uniref:ATPase inhibitor n=1 Tax=Arabis nemorensis TaxID=586526 RepID=A0A565CIA4_9BRAS|nr:unnamed protein product [Arabis nemorensis]